MFLTAPHGARRDAQRGGDERQGNGAAIPRHRRPCLRSLHNELKARSLSTGQTPASSACGSTSMRQPRPAHCLSAPMLVVRRTRSSGFPNGVSFREDLRRSEEILTGRFLQPKTAWLWLRPCGVRSRRASLDIVKKALETPKSRGIRTIGACLLPVAGRPRILRCEASTSQEETAA